MQAENGAQWTPSARPPAAESGNSEHRESPAFKRSPAVSSFAEGADQDSLLTRVIEDNVGLRESLKQH